MIYKDFSKLSRTLNPLVEGSNPSGPTKIYRIINNLANGAALGVSSFHAALPDYCQISSGCHARLESSAARSRACRATPCDARFKHESSVRRQFGHSVCPRVLARGTFHFQNLDCRHVRGRWRARSVLSARPDDGDLAHCHRISGNKTPPAARGPVAADR